ncbi:MAG: DUF2730 family protein [Pseudomonadota bacterium]
MKSVLAVWPVIVFLAQVLGILLVVWVDNRARKRVDDTADPMKADIRDLQTRMTKAEVHVTDLEADVEKMPTKADLERVMGEVKGAHREATAAANGIQRLEQMLMTRGMERT